RHEHYVWTTDEETIFQASGDPANRQRLTSTPRTKGWPTDAERVLGRRRRMTAGHAQQSAQEERDEATHLATRLDRREYRAGTARRSEPWRSTARGRRRHRRGVATTPVVDRARSTRGDRPHGSDVASPRDRSTGARRRG